jgi:NADPH:quinone reductase-like Zn-dependent oxidoreductase/acyl carrier protein
LLRSLGVRHVLDSRSLDFADEVLAATDGQGVDVVLNAIAGESVARSIACLAPYGRFVEIGKRDLLGDRNLGLRPFLRNLAYFSFDLRQTIVDRPLIVQAELEHLMKLFGEQQLRPLPHRVYHPSQTEAAFRRLAAAKHIGKLVVAMDERDVRVRPSDRRSQLEMRDTWLITGGLGGVGLTMADELAAAGVRHLVLVGRSGVPDEQTQARVDALRERGVEVIADAVDVTSRTQLAALLERIDRELPPLRGILHCAMVLDDALLVELNSERLTRVLEPKAAGAWYLHELTADLPLDAFVLFSSATSLIGNRGQANYAAANAFLDQLAEARRAGGRPAIALNLGAVSDVGYVARHGDVERMVAATGMRGFTAPEAFGVLQSLANGSHPQVGVLPMDWQQFFRHHGLSPESQPRYAELFNEHFDAEQGGADLAAGRTLREQLASRTAEARGELLRTELKVRVAGVLGIPIAELDEDMPLMDYLDSLLAVEISAWLERELGTKVTIMDLMKGPSVAQLAEGLLPQLADSAS